MAYEQRLRELREEKELTQTEVAGYLFVSQRTYSDYENGKIRIPVEALIILAKIYDVSMDYICGVTNHRNAFPKE